jgi:hypothetical protein
MLRMVLTVGMAFGIGLAFGPETARAVGGNDASPATKVDQTTQKCQATLGKGAAKYAGKTAQAMNACLDAILKCDEASDAGTALACRRKLLAPGSGKCAVGKLDEDVSLIGSGAALGAQAFPTSKAVLVRELNKYRTTLDAKCIALGAELGDEDTGLGFDPEPADALQLADAVNDDPGGLQCLVNGIVLEAYPLANEIVNVVEPLHETCITGALLGSACTTNGDCGSGGVCGKLARAVREGSIRSCAGVGRGRGFPATGQTACWNTAGSVIPCAGTGHDGAVQAGSELAYVDNGDGTITDLNTGLMWEKLSDDGSIHDWDTIYTWANAFALKIATLNSGGGFAGYTDWRLPNIRELLSIVNYQNSTPSVSPAFNNGCAPACTVTTCSCTASGFYWSSSTYPDFPVDAWGVNFFGGNGLAGGKAGTLRVRAVRGGL